MANRPSNSRIVNVINWGVDKRIPLGFIDTVIDKETGNLIGFMQDGEFYEPGAKPKKKPKAPEMPEVSGLTAADVNAGIPNGGVDPRQAAAYLNSSDPRLSEAAQKIILAQTAGLMDLDGNVAETAISRRDEAARLQSAADQKFTETIKTETIEKKKKANQEAVTKGYQTPYPDLEKPAKTETKSKAATTGGYSGIPSSQVQATYTGARQSAAASNAALGLSSAQMAPATPTPTPTPQASLGATGGGAGGGKDSGDKKKDKLTDAEREDKALGIAAGLSDFALPETLFNRVDSLKALLKDYVDTPGMTADAFRKKLRDDIWFRKNSEEIKARYVQLYNYEDLKASGQTDGSTDYEKQIATLERQVADKARTMGSAIASNPEKIALVARNMYITNQGIDDPMTTDLIAAAIGTIGGTIGGKPTEGYSGQALEDYQQLQSIAKANGFSMAEIIPGGANEQQVLEGIATGRMDVNFIAQSARRLATQGQPQYVRDLLGQGYNLDQVYAPYRQVMANILDIGDPNQIDLNDSTLRMAITDKGDMNLYDFKKALRQDERWQYTEQAKADVSTTALGVLRDFGFQG